jgi:steroid delta-isomerase-like uncharacterized protein
MTPRRRRLGAFIERVWNKGDAGAIAEFLAPAYSIRHDPGDPWEGRTLDIEGFANRLALSRAPFPDQRFEILGMFEDEGSIAMTWNWSATHLGEMAGFAPTGRTITMSGATVYTFDNDNRLTGHWQVADRLSVFRQLQAGTASRDAG